MAYLTHCGATTAAGEHCRAWAVTNSQPPLCNVHRGHQGTPGPPAGNQNARSHGFYAQLWSEAETADLVAMGDVVALSDELAAARIHLRRLMSFIGEAEQSETMTASRYASLSPLVSGQLNTIANLARTVHLLTGGLGAAVGSAVGEALDSLAELWGVEL